MKPAIPWALCAVVTVGAIGMNFYYRGALEAKSVELADAQEKYAKLESSREGLLYEV
jgi:hypothetical protein